MKNVLEELWNGFVEYKEFQLIVYILGVSLVFFFAFFW